MRSRTRQGKSLLVALGAQMSQSKVNWTRDLITPDSQLLPVSCILYMVYLISLSSLTCGSLFSLLQ